MPLPDGCPCCGGELELEDVVDQHPEEIVEVRAHLRRFWISHGCCRRCGRRAQGRHPGQTSDAIGAAGGQIGPRAVAIAAQLNKELVVAMGKVCQVLALLGLKVTAGGLHQALGRLAHVAEPTRQALVHAVRSSAAVAADETGWAWPAGSGGCGVRRRRRRHRVPHRPRPRLRVDQRHPRRRLRRGAGTRRRPRRPREMIAGAPDPQRQAHLHTELACLDGEIDALLERNATHPPNQKLLKHLASERDHLLTFLTTPRIAATTSRAEQAIRPSLANRKNWGGNRTSYGAHVQLTLMSVIRTSRQQQVCPIALLEDLLQPRLTSILRLPAATAVAILHDDIMGRLLRRRRTHRLQTHIAAESGTSTHPAHDGANSIQAM